MLAHRIVYLPPKLRPLGIISPSVTHPLAHAHHVSHHGRYESLVGRSTRVHRADLCYCTLHDYVRSKYLIQVCETTDRIVFFVICSSGMQLTPEESELAPAPGGRTRGIQWNRAVSSFTSKLIQP